MDPTIKSVFAISLVAAVVTGLFGWKQGWFDDLAGPSKTVTAVAPAAPKAPDAKSAETTPAEPKPAETTPAEPKTAEQGAPAQGSTKPDGEQSATRTPDAAAPGAATPKAEGATPGSGPAASGTAAVPPVAPGSAPAPAPADKGAFDVVRVEPSGEMVMAGRCPAGCTAELTANGETIDTQKADGSGNFAMVPPALPPGDHQLGLTVTTPDGQKKTSEQTVTVSVPQKPSKEVVVVLNDPDAPSKILQQPGQEPSAAKPAETAAIAPGQTPVAKVAGLALTAVDAENGRFFVQGTAPAGAKLRVYLNDAAISDVTAGADERWSLRVERGLTAGKYVVRVDQVDGGGKVATRVEQGFDYETEQQVAAAGPKADREPLAGAKAPASPTTTPAAAQPQPATPPAASSAGGQAPGSSDASGAGSATDATPAGPGSTAAATAPASGGSTSGGSAAAAGGSSATFSASGVAPSQQAAAGPSQASPADAANPVVAEIGTATVKRGDSLWRISRTTYGRGQRYTMIFTANDKQIRNPNLIYPGQLLVLPREGEKAGEP